jgi:hypothetical protein
MSNEPAKRDLLVLVADRNMEMAVRGVLARSKSLGIRQVTADVRRHPEHDCGCRQSGVEFLTVFIGQYGHALLVFDREGCGQDEDPAEDIESELEGALKKAGWEDRAAVIVPDPELEVWVWGDSPHVERELGWSGRQPTLREWLYEKGFLGAGQIKPARPKEAMEAALREVGKSRSSALFATLAERVSLKKCDDRAFLKLRTTLGNWFSAESATVEESEDD